MPASTTRLASAVKTARRLLNSIIAVVVLTAATIVFAAPTLAHDAPQGWSYPFSCCSGYDCRAVSQTSISERPEGYVIKGTGEVVGYSDARIKNSPDGEYHWCSVAGANDGKTICLFVPPSSF
jgi:hypothetical protein